MNSQSQKFAFDVLHNEALPFCKAPAMAPQLPRPVRLCRRLRKGERASLSALTEATSFRILKELPKANFVTQGRRFYDYRA